jgi:CBS domain-containing protein
LKKAEIQKFLSTHIPFSFLKEEEIKILTQNVSLKKFKKGETVFRVEDPPVKWLYILYEGFIVLTINSHVLEYVMPGEAFGVASAISGKPVRANALVEEDSVCILVPCEDFRRVFNLNRDFSSFYINLFEKRLTSLYRLYGGELIKLPEKYLIVSKVGDILTRKPVLCTLDTSIQDAVRLMQKEEVGSIIVVDKEKKPLGIITAKDLRKIIAEKISSTEPISTVMSSPVICINENSSIHDAYLLLISKTINHLVVVSNTTHIRGVITAKDLLLAMEPTYSLTILSKRIVKANSVDELKKLYEQTIKAIISLLNRGAGFYEISELLTEINDMFTRKIIEFAEKKLEEEESKHSA